MVTKQEALSHHHLNELVDKYVKIEQDAIDQIKENISNYEMGLITKVQALSFIDSVCARYIIETEGIDRGNISQDIITGFRLAKHI